MTYHDSNDSVIGCLCSVVVIMMIVMAVLIFVDRMTGYYKEDYGTVLDKQVHHEYYTTTDKDGKRHEHEDTYYYVYYKRKNGVTGKYDVGWWHYSDYTVGKIIKVFITVGGKSGNEYIRYIEPYEGAEIPQ